MVLDYEVSEYKTVSKRIYIEDTKNVFLQGIDIYNGLNTYFGIWDNGDGLVIVTLTSTGHICYEYFKDKNIYTESDIKAFLADTKNVKITTKAVFKEQLDKFYNIVKM